MFKVLFNDNWQFVLKEPGRELPEMEIETDWHDVEIPHDWLIGNPHHFYDTGEGWYKKEFNISSLNEDDAYIICFDGVYHFMKNLNIVFFRQSRIFFVLQCFEITFPFRSEFIIENW